MMLALMKKFKPLMLLLVSCRGTLRCDEPRPVRRGGGRGRGRGQHGGAEHAVEEEAGEDDPVGEQ